MRKFRRVLVVQGQIRKERYQKVCCARKIVVLLIKPTVFVSFLPLLKPPLHMHYLIFDING